MTFKYSVTPDEIEYLIRMILAILEEKKAKALK